MTHFQEVGQWVNWDKTCDQFLHGNPEAEVEGIAVAWIPTNEAIQEASEKGCNLFITHEPAFFSPYMQKQRQVQFIIVNHATAEKPGMQEMAKYLKRIFPDALVEYVDIRFPLTGISPLFHTGK